MIVLVNILLGSQKLPYRDNGNEKITTGRKMYSPLTEQSCGRTLAASKRKRTYMFFTV